MANQGRINIGVGFNVDQSGLNQLKASLASIQNMRAKDLVDIDANKAQEKLKQIKATAHEVEIALQQSFNPALNTYNIDTFKRKLEDSGHSLSTLRVRLSDAGAQGTIAFRDLATAISSTKLPLRESHDLIKAMGTTLMNTVKWTVASSAINTITGSVQKAWSYTKSLDESLNNIMIVTDKSADSMAQFARQANKAAKELGKSTRDYTDASLIYYQQGLDDAQVKARTETALRAANVTGQSADVVSEQLTAVWNGYKVQAQEAELYVDKLAAVAATTAADLEELSTGMSKVASAANTMGVDIDQLNAMLATTVSVTRQAPESVGTAFKTVFARIGDIEAGISDETTLGEYTKKMSEMGINVFDANNKLRDQGDVIEEIGNKWSSMSREQQIALSQTMAGTRQYNNLLALFDNWSMYEQAMKTSANAAGTLQKQQDTYMESIEAHMEQLRTAGERVYQALLDPRSANDLLDVLTEIVDKFGSFVESIGGGGSMLMSLIPIMTRMFSGNLANSAATFVTNLNNAKLQATQLSSVLNNIGSIDKTEGIDAYTQKINQLREAIVKLNQMGIISNEEFNEHDENLNNLVKQANAIDAKQQYLYGFTNKDGTIKIKSIEERFNNFRTEQFQWSDIEGNNLDFAELQELGNQVALGQIDNFDEYQNKIESVRAIFIDMANDIEKVDKKSINIQKSIDKTIGNLVKEDLNTDNAKNALSDIQNKFQGVYSQAQQLAKVPGLKTFELSLNRKQTEFNQIIADVQAGKRPVTDINQAFESMGKIIHNMAKRGTTSLEELEKGVLDIASGALPKMESELERTRITEERALQRQALEAKIQQFINLTSNIAMAANALRVLGNIGDIWSNEDLSTGEKLYQTITNVTSAAGMLLPAILSLKNAYQDQKEALEDINREQIKKNFNAGKEKKITEEQIELERELKALRKTDAKKGSLDPGKISRGSIRDKLKQNLSAEDEIKFEEILKSVGTDGKSLNDDEVREFSEKWAKYTNKDFKLDPKDISGGDVWSKLFSDKINSAKTNLAEGWKGFSTKEGATGAASIGKYLRIAAPYAIAIGAAIGAAAASLKIAEKVTNKEKDALEAASKAAETLNARLNKVKQDWDNLNSSIDKLNNASDTFKDLTVGTAEWKEALIDVNSQILELINKYPELAQYMTTDVNGMMSISAAGLEVAKDKQLEELNKANRAAILGQVAQDRANIEYQKNQAIEAKRGGAQDWATYGGAAVAGGAAVGGSVLGGMAVGAAAGSVVPIIGNIVGALVGLGVGVALAAGIQHANEAIEEKQKEYFESSSFDKVLNAYNQTGDQIFNSNVTLAKALGKDVSALTDMEKALVENKEETKKLCDAYTRERALNESRSLEIGRSILGQDANEGEAKAIGSQVIKEEEKILADLKKNAGGDKQDKAEAIEALEYLGIDASKFKGTKGANMIQYLDENGQTIEKSMDEIYQILAQGRASDWGNKESARILKDLNTAVGDYTGDLGDFLKTVGTDSFNFGGQTLVTFKGFQQVDSETLKNIAKAYGLDPEEILQKVREQERMAAESWNNPAALEGEALDAFRRVRSNVNLESVTLDAYTALAASFDGLFTKFGDNATNILYTVLNTAGDKAGELVNDLGNITWTADDARTQFVDLLNKLNITMDANLIDIYVEKMRQLNGAYGYSIDAIKSMVKELREMGDIKRGDIIDEEKYQKYLSKYGEDIANSLFASLGDGEYMAIAESSKYKSLNEARIRQQLLSDAESKKSRAEQLAGFAETFKEEKEFLQTNFKDPWEEQKKQSLDLYQSQLGGAIGAQILNAYKNVNQNVNEGILFGYYRDNKNKLNISSYQLQEMLKKGYISDDIISKYNSNALSPEEESALEQVAKIYHASTSSKITQPGTGDIQEWVSGPVKFQAEQDAEDAYYEALAEFKEKYGEFADGDLKDIQNAINDQYDTNVDTFKAYLSTATTFDELKAFADQQNEFGIYDNLVDENRQKDIQAEYKKQADRLAIQLFGQYDDLLGISADAIDNLLPNDPDLSIEERIEKYQDMFKMLVESTLEWESILENTERDLNKIEKVFEDVTGAAAISNLGKQIEALQQKQDLIDNYQKSWLGEEGILGKRLNASLGSLENAATEAGYTSFESNVDYSTFVKNGKVDWNAYANFEESVRTEFSAKGIEYQTVLDSVRESLEKTEEIEEQRLEAIKQEKQKRLEKFALEVELELDDENFTKKLNEYQRSLDDNRISTARTYLSDIEQELSIVETTKRGLSELDRLLQAGQITQEGYVAEYEKRLEELQSAQLAVQEDIKAIEEARVDALNDISESYEKQVSYLEQINSLLDTSKSSMELLYGEDAYELFDAYYQGTLNNALAIQEVAEKRFADAAAKYASINDGMSEEEKEVIIEEYTAAGQASAEAMYATMEVRRDKYLNDTEIAIKNFNKSIYGNLDTELFTEEWDWTKSQMDKYYDSVQTLFEKDKLVTQFDTAANEATSLRAQEQINKLKREELAQLEEIEKLSEYDVQHAQKKLDILQAEIALRETQENKTQMRLMRGADGSYSYQYVADQAAIAEAQSKLTEAQDALYNLEIEEYMSSIDEFQSATQALADSIRELGEDGFTDEELAFIEKQKAEIEYLAKRSSDIRSDVLDSAENAAETFGVNLSELTQGTILQMTKDIDTIIKEVAENGIQNSYDLLMAKITSISDEYIKAQGESVDLLQNKISGENGLIFAYEDLAVKEKVITEAHKSEYDYLVNNLGPELDSLKTRYENINLTLDQMVKHYEKLGLIKHNIDYDTSNSPTKNSGSDDDDTVNLDNKKDTGPQLPTIPQGGGGIVEPVQTYDYAGEELYKSDTITIGTSTGTIDLGKGWNGKTIIAKSLSGSTTRGGAFWVIEGRTGEYVKVADGKELIDAGGKNTQELKIVDDTIYLNANGTRFVKTVPIDMENEYRQNGDSAAWVRYIPIQYAWETRSGKNGWLDTLSAYDTGGYTGEWGADGRLAMLHEKEIVLNKHDTENFLDALSILRELNISMMAQIGHFGMPFSNSQTSILQQLASQPIEQNVTIQAEFPNATDKDEIKEAFNDLINLATQYVHQDNKH